MTKEEILKKQVFKLSNLGGFEIEVLEAMQDYADQETERLKAELSELKEKLNNECDIYVAELTKLIERVKELGSELSELKERHKRDVTKEVISFGIWFASTYNTDAMCGDDFNKRIPEIYKEYKEKFEK